MCLCLEGVLGHLVPRFLAGTRPRRQRSTPVTCACRIDWPRSQRRGRSPRTWIRGDRETGVPGDQAGSARPGEATPAQERALSSPRAPRRPEGDDHSVCGVRRAPGGGRGSGVSGTDRLSGWLSQRRWAAIGAAVVLAHADSVLLVREDGDRARHPRHTHPVGADCRVHGRFPLTSPEELVLSVLAAALGIPVSSPPKPRCRWSPRSSTEASASARRWPS
jgi:hypothetical protein